MDEGAMRLDAFLHQFGFAESRQKAKQLIINGNIYVDDECVRKPSASVTEKNHVEIKGDVMPYVGRGGLKLEAALRQFGLTVQNFRCVDIGASTGGFTDCLLQHGARVVYAIDSGSQQLAEKLKEDSRIVNMENFHVKNLNADVIGGRADFITADVSFISLTHVFVPVVQTLKYYTGGNNGKFTALIKPQFEAGRAALNKRGIVRDQRTHLRVILELREAARKQGLFLRDIMPSPILGGDGNREYLALFLRCPGGSETLLTENEIRLKCF